jgi:hypothetical protein
MLSVGEEQCEAMLEFDVSTLDASQHGGEAAG